jgi:flagellar basal body rod protein FlgC
MTDLITSKSAYQANITTIQTFKEMFSAGLEI